MDLVLCQSSYSFISYSYPAAGLGTYVEALVRKHDTEFNVCHYDLFNLKCFLFLPLILKLIVSYLSICLCVSF